VQFTFNLPHSPLALAMMWADLALCKLTSITLHIAQLTALHVVLSGRQDVVL